MANQNNAHSCVQESNVVSLRDDMRGTWDDITEVKVCLSAIQTRLELIEKSSDKRKLDCEKACECKHEILKKEISDSFSKVRDDFIKKNKEITELVSIIGRISSTTRLDSKNIDGIVRCIDEIYDRIYSTNEQSETLLQRVKVFLDDRDRNIDFWKRICKYVSIASAVVSVLYGAIVFIVKAITTITANYSIIPK